MPFHFSYLNLGNKNSNRGRIQRIKGWMLIGEGHLFDNSMWALILEKCLFVRALNRGITALYTLVRGGRDCDHECNEQKKRWLWLL